MPAKLSGSGSVIKHIAEGLSKKKYDVSIITSNALTARYWYDPIFGKKISEKKSIINGVKVYRLSCNQLLSSFYFILIRIFPFILPKSIFDRLNIAYQGPLLQGLDKFLQTHSFDFIHIGPFPYNLNKQVIQLTRLCNLQSKVIITPFFHSQVGDFFNKNFQEVFDIVNYIHVVSNAEKKEIQKKFIVQNEKFATIPLFLESHVHRNSSYLANTITELKKDRNLQGKKIILFAGNKGYMKGAITLLQAIVKLYKKDQSYILLAIGNSTPEWDACKKGVDQNALLDFGYVSEKEKSLLYAVCDIFCMPSKSESFGLTYLEAWQYKKAVIGCDIPSSKEIIRDNNAGLLVPFDNKVALEHAIVELFENPKKRAQFGKNGYTALMKKYTEEQFFSKFTTLLD